MGLEGAGKGLRKFSRYAGSTKFDVTKIPGFKTVAREKVNKAVGAVSGRSFLRQVSAAKTGLQKNKGQMFDVETDKIGKESEYIPIEINNRGISINNKFVEYEKFVSFYIDENNEENNYLLLKSKGTVFRDISVIIIEPEVDIDELRAFLLQHLTEKEIKQNSTDKLLNAF